MTEVLATEQKTSSWLICGSKSVTTPTLLWSAEASSAREGRLLTRSLTQWRYHLPIKGSKLNSRPTAGLLIQPRRSLILTPILSTGDCTVIHLQGCTLTQACEEPGLEGIAKDTKVSFPLLWFEEASGFSPGAIYLMLSNCFRCLMFKKSEHLQPLQGEKELAKSASCLVDTAPLPVCDHSRQVLWAC